MPLVCMLWMILSGNHSLKYILNNEAIARWLLYFGIYQWMVAEKNKESALPLGFWYFSIVGAMLILIYAALRRDPVLFLGNLGGLAMYLRNLILHYTGKGIFDLLPFDLGVMKKYFSKKP